MTRWNLFVALTAILFLVPAVVSAETTMDDAVVAAPAQDDGAFAEVEPEVAAVDLDGVDEATDVAATDVDVDADFGEAEIGWDQFDDPSFDPAAKNAESKESGFAGTGDQPTDDQLFGSVVDADAAPDKIQLEAPGLDTMPRIAGVVLGPRGVDDLGRAGRLHTVANGDTLWDLAAAYLGTPWVWPSVWIDNDDIENPHLILPGDKIWITANEMRVVTDAEAESFLSQASVPADGLASDGMSADSSHAMGEEDMFGDDAVAALDGAGDGDAGMDEPSTLEAFPVAVPTGSSEPSLRGRRITVAERESMGFVSAERFKGASSIVGSPIERIIISQGDDVVIGMGEGDVEVGDRFSVFTVVEEVRDPHTLRLLGHHVDPVGWAEVKELTGDTSIAEIRTAYAEIDRGARILPREPVPTTVEVLTTPEVIEGEVVFLPSERTLMADGGYVYLNRGEFHGVEVGSELEVFDAGVIVDEPERRTNVRTPDHVVARLVVVTVEPDSSVAFVLWSNRELIVGDTIRPVVPTLAQR